MSATPYITTQGCSLYILDDVTVPATPAILRIGAATGVTSVGGSKSDIDITNLDSTVKEFAPGLMDGGSPSFDLIFDAGSTSHALLNALSTQGTNSTKQWCFTFSDGTPTAPTATGGNIVVPTACSSLKFNAYVKQFQYDAATDNVIKAKIQLRATGPVTFTKHT